MLFSQIPDWDTTLMSGVYSQTGGFVSQKLLESSYIIVYMNYPLYGVQLVPSCEDACLHIPVLHKSMQ